MTHFQSQQDPASRVPETGMRPSLHLLSRLPSEGAERPLIPGLPTLQGSERPPVAGSPPLKGADRPPVMGFPTLEGTERPAGRGGLPLEGSHCPLKL
jgi:hypothetical protein